MQHVALPWYTWPYHGTNTLQWHTQMTSNMWPFVKAHGTKDGTSFAKARGTVHVQDKSTIKHRNSQHLKNEEQPTVQNSWENLTKTKKTKISTKSKGWKVGPAGFGSNLWFFLFFWFFRRFCICAVWADTCPSLSRVFFGFFGWLAQVQAEPWLGRCF